jgi:hypothetical protein
MNYTKPEVNILGDAKIAIEFNGVSKPILPTTDPTPMTATASPAYDLDE